MIFPVDISIPLTRHCNLNCAHCVAFAPLVKEPWFLSREEFVKSIDLLIEKNMPPRRLTLTGGEPLLHPDLVEFLGLSREKLPDSEIVILTNGVLLEKMPEEFFLAVEKLSVVVRVSDYPLPKHASCRKFSVGRLLWKASKLYREKRKVKEQCPSTCIWYKSLDKCNQLVDYKIYPCVCISRVYILNRYYGFNFEVTFRDYFDLLSDATGTDFLRWCSSSFDFCSYCAASVRVPWRLSEKKLSEWVIA
jgi:ABC-2 type transport system ATP-binding protein